ncbi:MAG: recombination mediator RecR [Candidatus Bipolaricaulota bacterium]
MIEPLRNAVQELKRLPGVGQKTAERLIFYLLTRDQQQVERLAQSLLALNRKVRQCTICHNFSESEICEICTDEERDQSKICVVSRPWDISKLENTGKYNGLYHVLGGLINPIEDVEPEDLHIQDLLARIRKGDVEELIIALEPKTEGESTAMYLAKKVRQFDIDISQIAQGVPVGRDLEFTDKATLSKAFEGRREFE